MKKFKSVEFLLLILIGQILLLSILFVFPKEVKVIENKTTKTDSLILVELQEINKTLNKKDTININLSTIRGFSPTLFVSHDENSDEVTLGIINTLSLYPKK